MAFQLIPKVKRAIYDAVNAFKNPLGRYGQISSYDVNVVDFLKLIWDLPAMPSEDGRFRNAEADAYQHMINNDDWSLDEALLKRFNLLAGDEKYFVKYIETIVSPGVREGKDDIENFVEAINGELKDVDCELSIQDYINNLPCYKLMKGKGHEKLPSDISPNQIPVFVDEMPSEFPSFLLQEYTWDDYGNKTRYRLYYYESETSYRTIGVVRIMNRYDAVTYRKLPSKFTSLGNEYCSLGQSLDYYTSIKERLQLKYKDFLHSMRDAACFSRIADEFKDLSGFQHSLLRESAAQNALQYAIYVLAGYDYNEETSFVFKTELPYYKEENLNIKFNFGNINDYNNMNRIVALIGNNGVGKTTVLSQLAESIAKNDSSRFDPHVPIFSKVISASYSIFDDFFKVEGSSFNYRYCGVQKGNHELMTSADIAKRRREDIKLIKNYNRQHNLYNYLSMLFPQDIIDAMFDGIYEFDESKYMRIRERLSSGQSMLMNLVIEMVAHIRQNTLIMLDEPEIHLHPRGITTIVRIVNKICEDFFSCCIMATHSPVIVQEMLSRNVIVMDREKDGSPIVRPMRVESLGENLTTITEDIFGRDQVSPYYKKMMRELVDMKGNMEAVLQSIQNNDVPVSMALYMLIDKYLSER